MPIEFCPHCRVSQNMRSVVFQRDKPNKKEQTKKIETRTYHCEVCNTFVRDEEIELIRSPSQHKK